MRISEKIVEEEMVTADLSKYHSRMTVFHHINLFRDDNNFQDTFISQILITDEKYIEYYLRRSRGIMITMRLQVQFAVIVIIHLRRYLPARYKLYNCHDSKDHIVDVHIQLRVSLWEYR